MVSVPALKCVEYFTFATCVGLLPLSRDPPLPSRVACLADPSVKACVLCSFGYSSTKLDWCMPRSMCFSRGLHGNTFACDANTPVTRRGNPCMDGYGMQSNSSGSLLHAVLIWLMELDIVSMLFVGLAHVMVHWIVLHL